MDKDRPLGLLIGWISKRRFGAEFLSLFEKKIEMDENLDFSTDDPKNSLGGNEDGEGDKGNLNLVLGPPYDPRPHEDNARRTIAYLLIGLLWLIVAAMLELISFNLVKVEDIKEFGVLLGPIITLVSAATGFYYGTKTSAR